MAENQYLCEYCKGPIKNALIVLLCDACLKKATEDAKREKEKSNA